MLNFIIYIYNYLFLHQVLGSLDEIVIFHHLFIHAHHECRVHFHEYYVLKIVNAINNSLLIYIND